MRDDSINDLIATIAKLDSNGVQVLPEGRTKTTSPQVHSSTDLSNTQEGESRNPLRIFMACCMRVVVRCVRLWRCRLNDSRSFSLMLREIRQYRTFIRLTCYQNWWIRACSTVKLLTLQNFYQINDLCLTS